MHFIVEERLRLGRLTVVDATNVQKESRQPLITLTCKYYVLPVAIVFKTSERFVLTAISNAAIARSRLTCCASKACAGADLLAH